MLCSENDPKIFLNWGLLYTMVPSTGYKNKAFPDTPVPHATEVPLVESHPYTRPTIKYKHFVSGLSAAVVTFGCTVGVSICIFCLFYHCCHKMFTRSPPETFNTTRHHHTSSMNNSFRRSRVSDDLDNRESSLVSLESISRSRDSSPLPGLPVHDSEPSHWARDDSSPFTL